MAAAGVFDLADFEQVYQQANMPTDRHAILHLKRFFHWWVFRSRLQKISWKILAGFLLPMALDGGTHFISDLSGHHQGFRDTNVWLAALTQHT